MQATCRFVLKREVRCLSQKAAFAASAEVTGASSAVKRLERKAVFETCGELFHQERNDCLLKRFRFRNAPNGLKVSATYVDTAPDRILPTVLVVHGIPGHYGHFNDMFEYFSARNDRIRFIGLNLPDFTLTRASNAFFHSNRERYHFTRDFLRHLHVTRLRCLVAHSAGSHVAASFWSRDHGLVTDSNPPLDVASFRSDSNPPLDVDSFVILSPTRPTADVDTWRAKFFGQAASWPLSRRILDVLKPHEILARLRYPLVLKNVDEFLWISYFPPRNAWREVPVRCRQLAAKKTPTLMVIGEKDRLFPAVAFFRIVYDYFGADDDNIVVFDSNGIRLNEAKKSWLRVLDFRAGGHMTHVRYSNIVNEEIDRFLARVATLREQHSTTNECLN